MDWRCGAHPAARGQGDHGRGKDPLWGAGGCTVDQGPDAAVAEGAMTVGASAFVCVLCCEGRDRRGREGVRGGQFKRGRGEEEEGRDWWKGE